jgi:hypothetical protein
MDKIQKYNSFNEFLGYTEVTEFLDQLSDYYFLKKGLCSTELVTCLVS